MSSDPLDPGSEAARNPHGYDIAEWSATYDLAHHEYPGGGTGYEEQPLGGEPYVPPLPLPVPPVPRRSLVYLSGPPASGKSTLMAHLTRYCLRDPLITRGPARDLLRLPRPAARALAMPTAIELGKRRITFSGTDALPMNAVVAAEQYMATNGRAHSLVLGEGDRLANRRFLIGSRTAGWDVTLVHLDALAPTLDARCRERGSTQTAGWRAGRETKAINLSTAMTAEGIRVVHMCTNCPLPEVAADIVGQVPVLAALFPPDAPEVQP